MAVFGWKWSFNKYFAKTTSRLSSAAQLTASAEAFCYTLTKGDGGINYLLTQIWVQKYNSSVPFNYGFTVYETYTK